MDTEDDIYQLSNYFLKGPREGEQAAEGSEKGAKDEETVEEKEGIEEKSGGVDEGEKKDDEGSVVFSVDEKASDSSSVKAHLSGNEAAVLILVLSLCTTTFQCRLKALVNENTLLRTHCCRRKCFPVCPRAQHLLRTQKKVSAETFSVRNKCLPVCNAQETSWATMCATFTRTFRDRKKIQFNDLYLFVCRLHILQ